MAITFQLSDLENSKTLLSLLKIGLEVFFEGDTCGFLVKNPILLFVVYYPSLVMSGDDEEIEYPL